MMVDIFIIASLATLLAIPLALIINRIDRWLKWRRIIHAVEQPTIKRFHVERDIPSPAPNVTAIRRKPTLPKAAA